MKRIIFIFAICYFSAFAFANTLMWNDNSNIEEGFIIEMLSGGAWVEVARVAENVAQYSDANTEGIYRVRAYLGETISEPSNTAVKLNGPVNAKIE